MVFSFTFVFIVGCNSASKHQESLHSSNEREMTVGIVQRDIAVGMSQADVAQALGSPNIVSKDSQGNQTWIYDKIATEVSYSKGSSGLTAGAAGIVDSWSMILGGRAGYSKSAGASSQTQKTLTVVIKFDENNLVKTLSYHSSKF